MTKQDVYRLIAQLRHSEVEKAGCGRRAVNFYNSLRAGLAK